MKSHSYMTRALRARDPRFANILGKLGYERRDLVVTETSHPLDHDGDGRKGGSLKREASDNLTALRKKYQTKTGKRPFRQWDAATIEAKLAEAD
ncbi:hypothetical protein [Rhizobium rhizophilum]|uniref:Uncharacterized protein n=1 Tax=Rhizobium rhizophilum TaxID=1850373 RepID=A0ABY2QT17_9HYPH|nr:hypothetical protein [Rhizobium rhizophilum]THV13738.1 hypothetical protein E9677_12575 [Rhizobium rhizophilum]